MANEDDNDRSFKCINCGEMNLVSESRKLLELEPKEDWTIKTTKSIRRRFKEICSRKGMDFNDGLLYLIALYEKEVLGKTAETPFGVPGTGK